MKCGASSPLMRRGPGYLLVVAVVGVGVLQASAAKEMQVPHGRAEAAPQNMKTLAEHFGIERNALRDDACSKDAKLLSDSPAYSAAFNEVMSAAADVGKVTGAICASLSIECRVPAPGNDGETVAARCCGTEALPLWKTIADEKLQAMMNEGRKILPYPAGGLLWFSLGLEYSEKSSDMNSTIFAMGWSHALPVFMPASCMTADALGPFIESLDHGCLAYDSNNVACGYNLLNPVV